MSDVKRYSIVTDSLDIQAYYVLASDYNALDQRCRELEDYIDNHSVVTGDYIARLQRTLDERDALRAEVERLRARLRRIESIAECGSVQAWLGMPDDVKAQWFAMHLELDAERLELRAERDQLQRIARHLVRTYIVDDQAFDPEAETNKAIAKILEQHK